MATRLRCEQQNPLQYRRLQGLDAFVSGILTNGAAAVEVDTNTTNVRMVWTYLLEMVTSMPRTQLRGMSPQAQLFCISLVILRP